MKYEIKLIIEHIRCEKIPDGYTKSRAGIFPKEWKIIPIKERFNKLTRKSNEENQNVLTISAQYGLINQEDYYNSPYASENKEGYSLLYLGDFAYNKSYSGEYLYGAIKRLDRYEKGIVSPLYICFEPKDDTNSEFYIQYFEAGMINREIYKIAQEGARNHGLLNVSAADFFNVHIAEPSAKEQQKISEVLMQCDKVIELKQKLIDELQMLKKIYLSKMFPKKGSNVPEIRFKGFTDPWEQRKLGEYIQIMSGEAPSKFKNGNIPYVKVDDLNYTYKYVTDTQNHVNDTPVIHKVIKESVIFPKRGAAILTNKVRILAVESYMDTNMMAVYSDKLNMEFLYTLLSKEGLYKIADTSTIPQINNKHIVPYMVVIPDLEEQEKLGKYFKQIDSLITLHQRELAENKKLKKSLMQLLLTGIVRVNCDG